MRYFRSMFGGLSINEFGFCLITEDMADEIVEKKKTNNEIAILADLFGGNKWFGVLAVSSQSFLVQK